MIYVDEGSREISIYTYTCMKYNPSMDGCLKPNPRAS
jgi:hypothetical protein